MTDHEPWLIEQAFALKQASLRSVHERNVRHGHIPSPPNWLARRPIAPCQAEWMTTLPPDPIHLNPVREKRHDGASTIIACEAIGFSKSF
ncbi:MAG TPA: hypothetical protein DEW46_02320 [Verrucomicrobia bacterium]|nr:hypothetical protein [Verrucomicrobiota bacterium]